VTSAVQSCDSFTHAIPAVRKLYDLALSFTHDKKQQTAVASLLTASFIKPMLLLRTGRLLEGSKWTYEIKLDLYRAIAGKVHLRSRNDNDFKARYASIVEALTPLANNTLIDGEVVALDADGRPSFNTLQNYGSAGAPLHFYVFDLLVLEGRNVTKEALETRRRLLEEPLLPKL